MSYNKSHFADLSFEELIDFSPNLKGWRRYFFIGVSMIAIILALIVQKAIYKSLKNLGSRPIMEMIIPSQVSIFYSNYYLVMSLTGVYRRSIFKIRPNKLIGLQKLRLRPKDGSRLFIYLIFLRQFS